MSKMVAYRSTWDELLSGFRDFNSDVYFKESYHQLQASDHAVSQCFIYQEGDHTFILPFILREIPEQAGYFDIESAYGYGGPLATTEDKGFLERANALFIEHSREKNVIAAFIRCHPLIENHRFLQEATLTKERETVIMNLAEDYSACIDKSYQYEIRRAEKAGVTIHFDDSLFRLEEFVSMYEITMHRLNASPFYFFSSNYFKTLRDKCAGNAFLAFAEYEGESIAAGLFLLSEKYGHYHLGARLVDDRYDNLSASKLVIEKSAAKLSAQGVSYLHLGAGTTGRSDDSLFRFKLGFSGKTRPFYTARLVINSDRYSTLCEEWSRKSPEKVPQFGNYFLKYRF